ncbi:amidase family protein [Jeotgalibaca ciconiae]|uniref:Amidase domain-containing protein n=1 Tax=Jeotgalibaca ciconiae TaxID=2496265 RepID=A0A3S9HBM5_9LACT|nr:amidase family protein [Jeotgalibaca ciconiae]AZP04778.1 hypothetical protein EJN90_09095 [Jeotgalibaca ciconiae]HJB23861.1 hypothetical protein [Candidatus Jeotgalibaca pullicola]
MQTNEIVAAANKSFIAMKNPYGSIEKVFPRILEKFTADKRYRYLGVKNKIQVSRELVKTLELNGDYLLHTIDKASMGGRAIDVTMVNPISGRPMTGSSSGTAINVLLGINDLGVGTDGGGSVLAPAMALNLFGFISNLIDEDYLQSFSSTSTDGISFSPSIGFIARTMKEMLHAINSVLNLENSERIQNPIVAKSEKMLDIYGSRDPLINYLSNVLPTCDFLVSEEGPIDAVGFGDTVFGHLGQQAREIQRASNKGLIRVVNMVNATAIVVPKQEFACAHVLICESKRAKINAMLQYAQKISLPQDELLKKYFQKIENYFPDEFI